MAKERNPKHSSERSESHKSNPVQGQNEPKYGKPQGQNQGSAQEKYGKPQGQAGQGQERQGNGSITRDESSSQGSKQSNGQGSSQEKYGKSQDQAGQGQERKGNGSGYNK